MLSPPLPCHPPDPGPIAVICRRQVQIQKDSSSLRPPSPATSALTENAAKFGQIRLGVRPYEMVIIMIRGDKER